MGLGAICVVFEPRMADAVRCRPWVPCVRALHSEHVRRVPFELYLESWLAELSEVMDFHQFSLKKAPTLPATSHTVMGHYSSPSPSPAAVGSDSGDVEKAEGGGTQSLASQASGVWGSGAAVRSGPVSSGLAQCAGAGAGASKGTGVLCPPKGFGWGISDMQGAKGDTWRGLVIWG